MPQVASDYIGGNSGQSRPTSFQDPIHIGHVARNAVVFWSAIVYVLPLDVFLSFGICEDASNPCSFRREHAFNDNNYYKRRVGIKHEEFSKPFSHHPYRILKRILQSTRRSVSTRFELLTCFFQLFQPGLKS